MVWELIEKPTSKGDEPPRRTERMEVPGGYLYRTIVSGWGSKGSTMPACVAMVFVPGAP